MSFQYIPDIVASVAQNVSTKMLARATDPFEVFFDYGDQIVIEQNLKMKSAGITTKTKRYPLIWLVIPMEETKGYDANVYADVSVDIIIIHQTSKDYSMQERKDKVLFPRLKPIYDELLSQLARSRDFRTPNVDLLQHKMTYFPYWGNGQANLLGDFIDAIQIKGLKLQVRNNCAQTTLK